MAPHPLPRHAPRPRGRARLRAALAALAALTLLLGACRAGDDGTGAAVTKTTPAGDDVPTSPFGPDRSGLRCRGLAVGLLGPVDNGGPDALARGVEVSRGAALAVEDFVRDHPDCPVELVRFDTWGTSQGATAAARAAVADDRVVAVVGPMLNAEVSAVITLDDAGLLAMSPSTTDPDIAAGGWKVFHRTSWAGDPVEALAAWAVAQRGTAVAAVVDDGSDDAASDMDELRSALEALGVRLVATSPVEEAEGAPPAELVAVVEELRADPVDSVFYAGDPALGGRLVKQLRDGGVDAQVLGTPGLRDRRFLDMAGGAAEGVMVLSPTAPAAELPAAEAFVAAYRMRHLPLSPGPFAAEAHDATRVVLDAVAAGAVTRASVLGHLAGRRVEGATGTLAFAAGPGQDDIDLGPWLSTVEAGRFVPAGRAGPSGG